VKNSLQPALLRTEQSRALITAALTSTTATKVVNRQSSDEPNVNAPRTIIMKTTIQIGRDAAILDAAVFVSGSMDEPPLDLALNEGPPCEENAMAVPQAGPALALWP
jgi:hypothetical protein